MALVGTLGSAALALKFGLDVREVNSQLDKYRRFNCVGQPPICTDVHGNSVPDTNIDQKATAKSLQDDGRRDQLLQWVFVGLTGAFAIAGGVLLYKGYLSSEAPQTASNHGLRLFPTATASSGGIIAEFEF